MDKVLARMAVLLLRDHPVGRTALNKLLFFADVAYFIDSEQKISSSEYLKMEYGPVPEGIDEVRDSLLNSGLLQSSVELMGPYIQHTYCSADLREDQFKRIEETFDSKQLKMIAAVKLAFGSQSAVALSALSHRFEPWKSANYYDKLDFQRARGDQELRRMLIDQDIIENN